MNTESQKLTKNEIKTIRKRNIRFGLYMIWSVFQSCDKKERIDIMFNIREVYEDFLKVSRAYKPTHIFDKKFKEIVLEHLDSDREKESIIDIAKLGASFLLLHPNEKMLRQVYFGDVTTKATKDYEDKIYKECAQTLEKILQLREEKRQPTLKEVV